MAYQIVVTDQFQATTANTFRWLETEWSTQSADKFQQKLAIAIERIRKSPNTGRISSYNKKIRSVPVTKHNRIYYKIEPGRIVLLELFETKVDPGRNKFD